MGREPTDREQLVFETVRNARDAAIAAVETAPSPRAAPFAASRPTMPPRSHSRRPASADYFTHRTGHNIAQELHGPGAHLDNLETHDERLILPNTCFSVEPGIYLPEFGVRSEVDMMTVAGQGLGHGQDSARAGENLDVAVGHAALGQILLMVSLSPPEGLGRHNLRHNLLRLVALRGCEFFNLRARGSLLLG